MAAARKQVVKYCRIFQWIEDHDADFAAAIRDLCLKKALDPGEGGSLTLLWPDDAYLKEITAQAYTDQADDAANKINSLIVDGWNGASTGNYTTRCGASFAVANNVLTYTNGTIVNATAVQGFAPRASAKIAIVAVSGAALEPIRPPTAKDVTGAAQARRRKVKKVAGRRAVRGGDETRKNIAKAVETAYAACVEKDGCRSANPYLGSVVSLLNYLKANNADTLQAVLLMIDYEPVIAFYLLVEPYRANGHIISDDIIAAWNNVVMYSDAVAEYKAFFESLAGQTVAGAATTPLAFCGRARLIEKTDLIRQDIGEEIRAVSDGVNNAYVTLTTANQIHGCGPVLPAATLALYSNNQLKLWQDMFRYCTHKKLCDLRAYPFNRRSFAELVEKISTWQSTGALPMGDLKQASGDIVSRFKLIELWCFVNSYDFLYIPSGSASVGPKMGDGSPKAEEPLNRAAVDAPMLEETTGMKGLSDSTVAELQAAITANGGTLPPQIQAMIN